MDIVVSRDFFAFGLQGPDGTIGREGFCEVVTDFWESLVGVPQTTDVGLLI